MCQLIKKLKDKLVEKRARWTRNENEARRLGRWEMVYVAVPASAAVLDNRCYYISCKRRRRSCSTEKPLSKLSFNFKSTLLGVLLGKLSTSHSPSPSPSPKRISANHITNWWVALPLTYSNLPSPIQLFILIYAHPFDHILLHFSRAML